MKIYLLISCFVIPYLLLFKKTHDVIKKLLTKNILILIAGLLFFSAYPLIYDIIKSGLNIAGVFFRVIYLVIPFAGILLKDKLINREIYRRLVDIIIFLFIWFPVQFNLLPGGEVKFTDFMTIRTTLMGMIPVGLFLYIIVSPLPETDFILKLNLSRKDIKNIIISYILIIIIIMPIGMLIKFLAIKNNPGFFIYFFVNFILLFFLIAIPEEFYFRAVLINAIRQKRNISQYILILISSVFFGFAHVMTPSPRWDVPNWPYVAFAAVAGAFYTWVYLKTKKFLAPVLLHALTDATWFYFFM